MYEPGAVLAITNEAVTSPPEIEHVSFTPAPSSDNVQLVSFGEKLDPETPTVVPGGPDWELSVIEGVPEVDVLDVTFVDSVEFESVDVILRLDVAFVDSVEFETVDVILRLDVAFVDSVEFETVDVILRLDVAFVDSVELETVDVMLRVELLEFERTLWAVFVTLRLVWETLSFSAEYEALLVTDELLGEFVRAVWVLLVTLRPVCDTLSFVSRDETVPVISGLEPNA